MSARLQTAAEHLAEIASGMGDADALRGLTCTEVEAIADVLRAIGRADAAETIIGAHASGDDDEDDMHHGDYLAYEAEHARMDAEIAARRAAERA